MRTAGTPVDERLRHEPLDPATVRVTEEPLTVESSFVLDLYTFFHAKDRQSFRVEFPDGEDTSVVAHLLVPPGPGPHPAVVVFPILAGNHVVSEALAKALADRGFAAARLERRPLALDRAEDVSVLLERFSAAVRDGRRLIDWLESRSDIDAERIGVAGVSLGSLLACLVHAADPRVRASFLALAGGGLPEILYDSTERPVRVFRDRLIERHQLASRAEFLAFLRERVDPVEPLRYARELAPSDVLLLSGRFDRVIPPARAEALWTALGEPRWIRLPTGHYQALPFLWYAAARAAEHFEQSFATVQVDARAAFR